MHFLRRFFFTFIYGVLGLYVAFPVSYFFQGDIYQEMSFFDYLLRGSDSIAIGFMFGSVEVYKKSIYFCIIFMIALGYLIEKLLLKRNK